MISTNYIELKGSAWINPDILEHIVPLSRQVVELLAEIHKSNSKSQYLFPNRLHPQRFMSENIKLYALYRMGYHSKATDHGFRATASTILNKKGFAPDVIGSLPTESATKSTPLKITVNNCLSIAR